MLRQVFITQEQNIIYRQDFGKAINNDNIDTVFSTIHKEAFRVQAENIFTNDFFKYRVSYLSLPNLQFLFIFVADLADNQEDVEKELQKCKKEFLGLFEPLLEAGMELDEDSFDLFNPVIESIHKSMRPKISLVGFSGVGKTTITRLIKAEDIPTEHLPTISGDIGTIKIGKLHFNLWDFAGQEQFSYLWGNFVAGSDVVLIITDSTVENVDKSRFFTELVKQEAPYSHVAVIGNKQDLPEAIPVSDIERILGQKAYSMIATDPDNRSKMIQIIADVLEISGEISPLLKPLIERDNKIKEAEKAIQSGDIATATNLFEEIADLSLELGDDRLHQDFLNRSVKMRNMIQASAQNTPPIQQPVLEVGAPENPVIKQPSFMRNTPPAPQIQQPTPQPPAPQIQQPTPQPPAPQIQQPIPQPPAPQVQPNTNPLDNKIEDIIKDLKIKIAHINQKIFDLEMDNISGDLDDETFYNKSQRLEVLKSKVEKQLTYF